MKEQPMTNRNDQPVAYRAHRSELDHRAINVTGHLLLGVVWLERRIAYLPDQLGALIEMAGLSGLSGPLPHPVMSGQPDTNRETAGGRLDTRDHAATNWKD
jgi:hypothetical protein